MSYQVPQHIDKNKIFIVKRSEIEGRLDPKMALYNQESHSTQYHKIQLKKLLLKAPQYGAGESGVTRKSYQEPRYIRITDIDSNGIVNSKELGATANNIEDKYILNDGDILFARSGATVGKTYLHKTKPYMCFYAGYLIRFVVNTSLILPEYLFAYTQLPIYKKWIAAIQRPSAQPNINAEEYQSLEIPLPNLDIQHYICNIIKNGYLTKQKKEAEAQKLLDSIDGYILNELGITMPKSDLNLKERIFFCNFKQATGGRLDPKFNNQWQKLKSLQCNYPKVTLADVVFNSGQYGANETAIDYKEGDTRYIRITDIDDLGCLKENNKVTCKNIEQNYMLHKNDLLFARSGSVGKCYIHKRISEPAIFAGYLIRFIINAAIINPDYLFYYCNCSLYKYWVDTIQRPAVQANINSEEFRQIIIPLPPMAKQQEIADHITALRHQAAQLQQEGKEALEKAKQEVEQMILGK
ncbi:MAG: hypothetical protein EGS41_09195 [Prevotella sp.]|nr:hypothetical protein [Prevotella sp.]CDD20163.1 genome sequencing data contig C300 [Prevotella sp. CAG:732]